MRSATEPRQYPSEHCSCHHPKDLNDPSAEHAEINGFRYPVVRLNRSDLTEDLTSVFSNRDSRSEILLTDCGRLIQENGNFIFHNEPEMCFGGHNPMFIRFDSCCSKSVSEFVCNYYLGSPLRLSSEWTIPVNYFPNWNADRIQVAFDSCPTIGRKSWIPVEEDSDVPYRRFESRENKERSLLIREDGADAYILDETIDEWIAWSKKNRLHFR